MCCLVDPLREPRATVRQKEKNGEPISLLGVDYLHLQTEEGGDLYLTRYGQPWREQLAPGNWYAPDWFAARRSRLPGTSVIYRVPTRPIHGLSLQLVARFSRVGQPVPADTATVERHVEMEFNSPFEEFARVLELRAARVGLRGGRLLTKKPLAIYSPPQKLHLWQTGRWESKIAAKQALYPEAPLDPLRQYLLLYTWTKGLNAVQTADRLQMTGERRERFLSETTLLARRELEMRGFCMADIKPEHIVLRLQPDGRLLRRPDGEAAYVLVDYELLAPKKG